MDSKDSNLLGSFTIYRKIIYKKLKIVNYFILPILINLKFYLLFHQYFYLLINFIKLL